MNTRMIMYLFALLLPMIVPALATAQQVTDAWVYGGNDKIASNNCYIDQLGNRYQVIYTSASYFSIDSLGHNITINNPNQGGGSFASIVKYNFRGVYQYHVKIPNSLNLFYTSITFDQNNNAYFSSRIQTPVTSYSIYDGRKNPHSLQINTGINNTSIILGKLTANGEFSWLRVIQRKNGNDLPLGMNYNFHELLTTNSSKSEIKLIAPNYRPINNNTPDTLIITSNNSLNDTIIVRSILLHLNFLSIGDFKNYVEPLKNKLNNTCDGTGTLSIGDEPVDGPYNHILSKNKEYSLSILTLGLTADDTLLFLNQIIPLYEGINTVLICTNDNDSILWIKSLSRTITWTQLTTTRCASENEFHIFLKFNPATDVITIAPNLNNSPSPVLYHLKLNVLTGSFTSVKNLPSEISSVIWNPISKKYVYISSNTYGYLDSNSTILSTKYVTPLPINGTILCLNNTSEYTTDSSGYTYITGTITDSIKFDCITRYANSSHIRQKVLVTKISPLKTIDSFSCTPILSPSGMYLWDTSGIYYDTIPTMTNCDSIIEIRFTNLSSKNNYDSSVLVFMKSPSGKYTWDSTGIYNDTLTNKFGCDSIIIFNLKILQSKHTIDTTVCNTYLSPSGNYSFDSSGSYKDTIPNIFGADSIITINLRVLKSFSSFDTTFCSSITSPSGRYIYYNTGTYNDTIINTGGCDSIINIRFILQHTKDTINVSSCNTFISPSGKYRYTQTGMYIDTLKTNTGCDSVIWINYTNKKTIDSVTFQSCDSAISPSGKFTMKSTGLYIDTLANISGCDSIIYIQFIKDSFNVYLSKTNNISCDSPITTLITNSGNLFTWFENGNELTHKSATITVAPTNHTVYKVIVRNNLGCLATDSIVVLTNKIDSSVTLPNVFTPNNDGVNDCYCIAGAENSNEFYFEVYSRWGQLIYRTNSPSFCWNGKTNTGEDAPAGTYFYVLVIESNCSNQFKSNGTIMLLR